MIDGVPAADRYLFDLEGYLVIEDALDATQVAAVNAEVDRLLEDADPDATTVSFGAGGGELVGERGVFLDLVDNPRVAPYLEALVDPDVRLDHEYVHVLRPGIGATGLSSAVLHGGGTPFDASQWFRFADGRTWSGLTVVAYHLRDVDPADGGLAIVPGSHKANLPFPDEWRDLDVVRHPSVRRVGGRGRHCGGVQRGVHPRDPALARCRRAAHAVLQVQPAPDLLVVALLRPRRPRAADGAPAPAAGGTERPLAAAPRAPLTLTPSPRGWRGSCPGCPPRRAACPRGSP